MSIKPVRSRPVDAPLEAPESSPTTAAPTEQNRDFLSLLSSPRAEPRWPLEPMFVATCVDARHPTLVGRVLARWEDGAGAPQQWWLPTLHGLAIRAGDRLLLSRVGGLPEPVAVGVIDGFLPRPVPSPTTAASLELLPDEALTIVEASGQPLLQIRPGEEGPVVRLLHVDTQIELPGRLSITAGELSLKAVRGNVQIEASDEVAVIGEAVRLN